MRYDNNLPYNSIDLYDSNKTEVKIVCKLESIWQYYDRTFILYMLIQKTNMIDRQVEILNKH